MNVVSTTCIDTHLAVSEIHTLLLSHLDQTPMAIPRSHSSTQGLCRFAPAFWRLRHLTQSDAGEVAIGQIHPHSRSRMSKLQLVRVDNSSLRTISAGVCDRPRVRCTGAAYLVASKPGSISSRLPDCPASIIHVPKAADMLVTMPSHSFVVLAWFASCYCAATLKQVQ